MIKSSNLFACFAARARAPFAVAAGLALFLAGAPSLAAETVIWTRSGSGGVWDTTSANWAASGSDTLFTDGDAVVFGLDADGNATNTNARVDIIGTGVNIAPQPYGHTASGTNPGMIVGSGSWFFVGGTITGGSILITGSSALQFANAVYDPATNAGGGRLYIYDQRIDVVDNADFKYSTSIAQTLEHSGTAAKTVNGGAISTGTNTTLTLEGTYGGIFFYTQTTSQQGGAIYAGGDLDVHQAATGTGTLNWFNFVLEDNSADKQGGAIYSKGDITMSSSSGTTALLTPVFTNNKSGAEGGAIYTEGNITINASGTFIGNTAGGSGGAIYAKGDVSMTGATTITGNTSGTNSLGGAIYAGKNLTISGSNSRLAIYGNKISGSGAPQTTSLAYVGGTFSLADNATLVGGGGIAAQSIVVSSATLKFGDGDEFTPSDSRLTLTIIDASGSATAGTIRFENTTLYTDSGALSVNAGSKIEISGSAFTINAIGGGQSSDFGTVISAGITGTAEVIKTGAGVASLTGSNTYTGTTRIMAGTLIGNTGSSINISAGATYTTGRYTEVTTSSGTINVATDRTFDRIDGMGTINMQEHANLTVNSGNFTGTMRNTGTLTKKTAAVLTIGTGTVTGLDVAEGTLNIGGEKTLTVTGTTTLAASTTLGVNFSDTTALHTGFLDTAAGSVINIAGVGNISNYDGAGSYTLISSDNVITGTYAFLINGEAITSNITQSQFLKIDAVTTTSTAISVQTSLIWNGTAANSAHGTFRIDSGIFNLNAPLANNTDPGTWFTDIATGNTWDGESLTKTGDGILILSNTNTYTGATLVENGILINQGVIGAGDVIIQGTPATSGTMINHGIIGGDVANAGYFAFETRAITTATTTTESGSIARAGSTATVTNPDGSQTTTTISYAITGSDAASYETTGTTTTTTISNGKLEGNVENTGTFNINLSLDYAWSGTLTGTTGLIIKTGTSAFTLDGGNTFTGTVQVNHGALTSGAAHNLDSVGTYHLPSTSGTLNFAGHNQTLKNVINDGALSFGPGPAAGATTFSTVTIGSYASGSNATGIIEMRSNYNAGLADRLHISGTASGTHTIRILESGSATPGKTNPYIPLIDGPGVAASNTNISFVGAIDVGMGRLIVARGDGGSGLGGDPDIWYLASGNQASNVADAILSTASVAGLEWHYQLDTVRQRMGDLRQETLMAPPSKRESPLAYTTVRSKGGNAWLRGNTYHLDADAGITNDAFEEDVYGISFGYDKTYRWEDNQYLLGAYANISNVSRDFDTRGDGKTSSYGGGLYFSYLKDNGWYGDASLLVTSNNNEFTTHPIDRPGNIITADYGTHAWGLSFEAGKIIKSKKTGWWIEPSAQAALAVVNGKIYTTNTGMEVKMADANIYQYRAAIRAGRDITGTRIKPYIRAAIAKVSTRGGRIRAGSPDYPQYYTADMDGQRLEGGAGASWVIDEKSQVYLDYEYAKASNYNRPWAFNFGYRCTW